MRTIKFRAQKTTNGIWVYGSLVYSNELDAAIYYQVGNGSVKSMEWVYVKPDTICQFTGLHDKNGKEIYEGDILRYPAEDKFDEENFVSFEVFWHDNDCADNHVGWQMNRHHFHGNICGTRDISTFLPKYTKKMVVIGNIHDNPKLLEQ